MEIPVILKLLLAAIGAVAIYFFKKYFDNQSTDIKKLKEELANLKGQSENIKTRLDNAEANLYVLHDIRKDLQKIMTSIEVIRTRISHMDDKQIKAEEEIKDIKDKI